MSSQPPSRVLEFPFVWGTNREHDAPEALTEIYPSDEHVMARLQANDPSALNLLFARYARLVLSVALNVVRDRGRRKMLWCGSPTAVSSAPPCEGRLHAPERRSAACVPVVRFGVENAPDDAILRRPAARVAYLVRYADVSADGRFLNTLDSPQNTSAAWNTQDSGNLYSLQLQTVATPQFSFWGGFAQNTFQPPNACAFAFNYTGAVLTATNGSVETAYVTSVPANGSKTATMIYKGF